jgi:hypothetical protein
MNQAEKDLMEIDRLLASMEEKIDKCIDLMKKHETTSNSEINFLRKLYNKFIKVK